MRRVLFVASVARKKVRGRRSLESVVRKPVVALPFPSGARWDLDLDASGIRALGWQQKQVRVHEALKRKVALIEACADNPALLANEPNLPANRKALRDWSDPSRGLWSWTWVALDNEEHKTNGYLISAFNDASTKIADARTGKQSGLKREISILRETIAAYENRLALLLSEVIELRAIVYGKVELK